eukprot:TRINITY_DN10737_c0_g1_i1.p1 TRINITY_DN10737_c0_g1~~TRINITY_DN10737_c0_g1_i1.p1  ORF type:complete len:386 (-),score=86.81 TRINITY_DN10737_c0_g1_i1:65-1222(-)
MNTYSLMLSFTLILSLIASPYATKHIDSIFTEAGLPAEYNAVESEDYQGCYTSILNQGQCGSCWAFSAVGALTDRYCLKKGKFDQNANEVISPQDLISCTTEIGNGYDNACGGGSMEVGWKFLYNQGSSTCANDCTSGCSPYTSANCKGDTNHDGCSACKNSCSSSGSFNTYKSSGYTFYRGATRIAQAIQHDGPVQTCFAIYQNFYSFNSEDSKAIYNNVSGGFQGNHCVKITGWSTSSDGTPYWIVANSWGRNWGDSGWFYMHRGSNVANFEQYIYAGCPAGMQCSYTGQAINATDVDMSGAVGGNWVESDLNNSFVEIASNYLRSGNSDLLGFEDHAVVKAETQVVAGVNVRLVVKNAGKLHEVVVHRDLDTVHQVLRSRVL